MREFYSLTAALEGYFEKPLAELPSADQPPGLRERVLEVFNLISWEILSADQRRQVAHQWDGQNDPAFEQERQRAWDAQVKCTDLEREIAEWQLMPAQTPTERIAKENRIAELQQHFSIAKQSLAKLLGTVDQTRAVGRPTPKGVIAAEFERRISRGELEQGVAAQARALKDWLSVNHPSEPQLTADTIEINIRHRFREVRNTGQK